MERSSITIRRRWATGLGVATLLAWLVVPTGAAAHPGDHGQQMTPGLGVQVNSPDDLVGFHPGVQWGDTGEVDFQTADLVYAGTSCTPASYAPVAADIQGNIALVDDRVSQTNPLDQCPTYTFAQKVQSAERAGAIAFVQIVREGDEPNGNATAITAEIPALELERTDALLAVRDAVIAGTAVNATLTPAPPPPVLERLSDEPCVDGLAAETFPCEGVDLLSLVPADEIDVPGTGSISDIWGWTDPDSGDEYVIMGKTDGVAFFRITDPFNPVYLGELPNEAMLQRVWHDIKVFDNHAFIVSESEPHGMTVFDLTRLRGVEEAQEWDQDAFYRLHSAAHNLEINTDTGFAYIVGGNAALVVPDQCLSGLHMVDINDPTNPTFAGCYLEEGGPGTAARSVGGPATEVSPAAYVHDAQCVIYDGPDERYTGREICFNAAETQVVIVDVTDKQFPTTLGTVTYDDVGYTHQGWLTDDQAYWIVNDELDEEEGLVDNTRTIVLDVSDLENPTVHFEHLHDTVSPDHNNYVHEGLLYQSNYSSGLRVLDTASVGDPADPRLEEIAFFDTFPESEETFDGTWSNYPFFASGTIAVSGRNEGLFLLRLQDGVAPGEPAVELTCTNCPLTIRAGEDGVAELAVTNVGDVDDTYRLTVSGLPDGWAASVEPDELTVTTGDQGDAAVTIEVPHRQRAGSETFSVTATSTVDPEVSATVQVEVDVHKGKPSDVGPPHSAPPGRADTGQGESTSAQSAAEFSTASAPRADTGPPLGPVVVAMALLLLVGTASMLRRHRGH